MAGGNGTPIRLKEIVPLSTASISLDSTSASTSATATTTTSNSNTLVTPSQTITSSSNPGGKLSTPAAAVITSLPGMKIIPAVSGTRILPKLGTVVSTGLAGTTGATFHTSGTPIYMVATPGPGGQNVMRVARTLPAGSVTAAGAVIGGSPTTQRVVTLNASSLRTSSSSLSGSGGPGSIATPLISSSTIRTLQPRNIVHASGIGLSGTTGLVNRGGGITPSKPSVIVVQRGGLAQHHLISKNSSGSKVSHKLIPLVWQSKKHLLFYQSHNTKPPFWQPIILGYDYWWSKNSSNQDWQH